MVNRTACLDLIVNGALTKGDPDVSGAGVIVAFILSACITLAAVLAAYVFGLVDDGLLRPVDKLIMGVPSRAGRHPKLHVTLRKAVMTLSDQQIVTGIAILGAGFYQLRAGTINVYHFHVVIYLAWMSSSVHLSALTLLRPYLNHHRGVLLWRITGMLVLLAMLLVALIPTVSNDWAIVTVHANDLDNWTPTPKTAFGVPAICFWGQTYGDGVNPDAVISFLTLFVSYLWKAGGLFVPVRERFDVYVRNPTDGMLETPLHWLAQRYRTRGGRWSLWMYRVYLALYLTITAFLEVLGSFTAALWLSVLGLIYGIMQIVIPRSLVLASDPDVASQEDQLGFGQLVPLILLVQPLGACMEHIWLIGQDDEEVYEDQKGSEAQKASQKWFHEGYQAAKSSNKSLIVAMARYSVPGPTKQTPQRMHLKGLLYSSRLFASMVWLVQFAVAGTSSAVLYLDEDSIGFASSDNWFFITIAIGGYVAAGMVLVLVLAPCSRLGRSEPNPELSAPPDGEDVASSYEMPEIL